MQETAGSNLPYGNLKNSECSMGTQLIYTVPKDLEIR